MLSLPFAVLGEQTGNSADSERCIQFSNETIEKIPIEIVENLTRPIEEKFETTKTNKEQIETHQASNESAETIVEELEPLASLEELKPEFFESNSKDNSSPASDFERDFQEFKKDIDLRIEKLSKKNPKETEVAKHNRKTTVRYYLENRTHIALPIPVYKCITGGTIVIDIEVNAELPGVFPKLSSPCGYPSDDSD